MRQLELNVLTLNVWGIPIVSKNRKQRIPAIANELSTGKYDIVSLQEVWSQKDCELIKEKTVSVLPYSHYFYSGVIGAGLLVLSKYPITATLFHSWSVNGYFHRIQHADWFGGKGVGLCRIQVGDKIVHVYSAHLHAEYDKIDDYKTHRVIQAFDTAQFIRATRGNSVLQILAGDLNTQPEDICYKVLLYISKMRDCCNSDTIATNECEQNSYTSKKSIVNNPKGIRIDHIFIYYHHHQHIETTVVQYKLPFPNRVPGEKFSFSDHEAVEVKFLLTDRSGSSSASQTFSSFDDATVTATDLAKHMTTNKNGTIVLNATTSSTMAIKDISKTIPEANNDNISNKLKDEQPKTTVINRCINSEQNDENEMTNKRILVLNEAIELCDMSLQQLRVDRILYYSLTALMLFLLITLAEYSVPNGFKTLFLLLKLFIFVILIFTLFMASIWNFMERNGILAEKKSMEIMLQKLQKNLN